MRVPGNMDATVDENKISNYLFSLTHPVGKSKANYFCELLLNIIRNNDVSTIIESPFGVKFIVDGLIKSPSGLDILLTTIWFIEKTSTIPYFVTAYPSKMR